MSNVSLRVQTLIDARGLGRVNELLGQSLNRLSSGTRLISASDDPADAGAISKLEAQRKRAQAALVNVQNANSFVQSSNGFMNNLGQIAARMSELVQYSTDGLKSSGDVALYQAEFKELQDQLRVTIGGSIAEIGGTAGVAKPLGMFNGVELFGANPAGISIASGSHAGENIIIPEVNFRTGAVLELFKQDASGNYTMAATDATAQQKLDAAMTAIADGRSLRGAVGGRLELDAGSLAIESQNITAAVSRIQDVDVASESTRLSKMQLLYESGTAMLSQANQSPKSVLQLLQG